MLIFEDVLEEERWDWGGRSVWMSFGVWSSLVALFGFYGFAGQ